MGRFQTFFGLSSVSGTSPNVVESVAIDENGSIYLTGRVSRSFGALRLWPDGRRDATFAGATSTTGSSVTGLAFGDSLIVGGFNNDVIGGRVLLMKFRDGGLDPTFGNAGIVDTNVYHNRTRLVPGLDGGMFVVPSSALSGVSRVIAVTPDGRASEFASFGAPDASVQPTDLVQYPNGSVLVLGTTTNPTTHGAIAFGAGPTGGLDNGIHLDYAKFPLRFANGVNFKRASMQSDGKVVVVGLRVLTSTSPEAYVFLWRILQSGAADPTFNGGEPVDIKSSPLTAIAVDRFDRVVVLCGTSISRYWL